MGSTMITLHDAQRIVQISAKLQKLRLDKAFIEKGGYVRVVIADAHDRNEKLFIHRQSSDSQDARKIRGIAAAAVDRDIAAAERDLRALNAEVPA